MESLINEHEQNKLMERINKQDHTVVQDLTETFSPYIHGKHKENFKHNIIDIEDFMQECSMELFKRLGKFRNKHFGQVCNYVTTAIDSLTIDLTRKHNKYKKYEEYIEDMGVNYLPKRLNYVHSPLEEGVVNKIIDKQIYETFIKGKLPKRQEEAIRIFLQNHRNLEEYLKELNIKPENFRKNLSRAKNTIRQILATEAFKKFYYGSMFLMSVLSKTILCEELLFLSEL